MHRAFDYYCKGFRTAKIAELLGVDTRTVHTYLTPYWEQIGLEHRVDREKNMLRAVESQRAIAAESWDADEREVLLQAEILAGKHDYVRRRTIRPGKPGRPRKAGAATDDSASTHPAHALRSHAADDQDGDAAVVVEEIERPRLPTQAARYLATALAAQREIARLQRLYDVPSDYDEPTNIEIIITRRPDGPENIPPPNDLETLEALARGEQPDPDAAPPATWPAPALAADIAADPADVDGSPQVEDIADEGDIDLLDPGDTLPTVTRRAAGPSVAARPCKATARPATRHAPARTSRTCGGIRGRRPIACRAPRSGPSVGASGGRPAFEEAGRDFNRRPRPMRRHRAIRASRHLRPVPSTITRGDPGRTHRASGPTRHMPQAKSRMGAKG